MGQAHRFVNAACHWFQVEQIINSGDLFYSRTGRYAFFFRIGGGSPAGAGRKQKQ